MPIVALVLLALLFTAAPASARTGSLVRADQDQALGQILSDQKGQALYIFDREKQGRSRCYGACAEAWPPLITKGLPRAGKGARLAHLGTTRRKDGRLQVTYRGQPLYYYEHDTPTRTICHDVYEFGGNWLAIRPNGRPLPTR